MRERTGGIDPQQSVRQAEVGEEDGAVGQRHDVIGMSEHEAPVVGDGVGPAAVGLLARDRARLRLAIGADLGGHQTSPGVQIQAVGAVAVGAEGRKPGRRREHVDGLAIGVRDQQGAPGRQPAHAFPDQLDGAQAVER